MTYGHGLEPSGVVKSRPSTMIHELPYRRMLLLTEAHFGVFSAKTAVSMLRYRGRDVVGILDSQFPGGDVEWELEGAGRWPVFRRVDEAADRNPDAVLIGIAPVGGQLPEAMRRHVIDALTRGMSIISGLHMLLAEDPELAELSQRYGGRIHDVRDPGPIRRIAQGKSRYTKAKRVLTVGTDCNAGKMLTALELRKVAVAAGLDAAFVATGQTGIMIEGWGIAIDHVLSDFTAGAAELLVEHVADRQLCIVEGQGSIDHPGYSGVTLSLLHGVCPDAMVVCHRPDRRLHNDWEDCSVAPITDQIALYEQALAPLHPGKVVAVSVNTAGMPGNAAADAVEHVRSITGLPAADPVREGIEPLLEAVRRQVGL